MIRIIARFLTLLFFMMHCHSVAAQDSLFYQTKIDRFESNKTIGTVLIVAAAPLGGLGAFLFVQGTKKAQDLDYIFLSTGEAIAGIALVAVSVCSLAGGIVLTVIGNKKMKEYQSKLDGLKVGSHFGPNNMGITLTYRF